WYLAVVSVPAPLDQQPAAGTDAAARRHRRDRRTFDGCRVSRHPLFSRRVPAPGRGSASASPIAHLAGGHRGVKPHLTITLVGPGGAGKSTIGVLLAERLETSFVDLDQHFKARLGDISEYINRFGYAAYALQNVETYRSLMHEGAGRRVVALSSGFLTYPRD